MYSMMWPMWDGPFAYGRAVVTKSLRGMPVVYRHAESAGTRGALALILQRFELRLVDALLVGFLARYEALIEQLLNGRVHGAHAGLGARLHDVLELIELALADEIRGCRRIDEDLERSDPSLLVRPLQQLLRDDPAQRGGEHGAYVRLLVGREDVDDAIDCLRRTVRVQRAHDENAHLGRRDRDAHGFQIA